VQTALAAITAAGYDGLHTDELGAHVHAWQGKHQPTRRCECGPSELGHGCVSSATHNAAAKTLAATP
jgi:hypothetical protein